MGVEDRGGGGGGGGGKAETSSSRCKTLMEVSPTNSNFFSNFLDALVFSFYKIFEIKCPSSEEK